jgi:hypothetical protein
MKVEPKPSSSRMPPAADSGGQETSPPASESWSAQFDEMSEYLGHYFAARSDLFRVRSSKLVWNLAMGLGAGVVGLCLAAVAVSKLLGGVAGGLTILLGGRVWAGDLMTGVLVLTSAGVGFFLIRKRAEGERRRKLFAKYERRHDHQTERFGHDMSDRAAG